MWLAKSAGAADAAGAAGAAGERRDRDRGGSGAQVKRFTVCEAMALLYFDDRPWDMTETTKCGPGPGCIFADKSRLSPTKSLVARK